MSREQFGPKTFPCSYSHWQIQCVVDTAAKLEPRKNLHISLEGGKRMNANTDRTKWPSLSLYDWNFEMEYTSSPTFHWWHAELHVLIQVDLGCHVIPAKQCTFVFRW